MTEPGRHEAAYLLHQRFRYDYSAPIRHLVHRLMVVPPLDHGDQRRSRHGVEVGGATATAASRRDRFGNHVVDVRAAVVDRSIEFCAWAEVERGPDPIAARLPASAVRDPRWLRPSPLTVCDGVLAGAAQDLARPGLRPLELAEGISTWVHGAMRYGYDTTNVRTTASQALTAGEGVCQDYAHVMLALTRQCGLAARYVSGHLRGEGGSHAWVEVMVPDDRHPGSALAYPIDPTHDRRAGLGYVTIAVGREYADVAPTSGTFRSRSEAVGHLTCEKKLRAVDRFHPVLAGL